MSSSDPDLVDLVRAAGSHASAEHVERLTDEVYEFIVTRPDYAKAARPMGEVFHLTGRDIEAAYIGVVFTELIVAALPALEGQATAEAVGRRLRQGVALPGWAGAAHRAQNGAEEGSAIRADARLAVSDYVERAMRAVPSIRSYLESVAAAPGVGRPSGETAAAGDPMAPKRDGAGEG
jgi:hypothetical protein